MDDLNEQSRTHSAGGTMPHGTPFETLVTHKNPEALTDAFVNKWVVPFYLKIGSHPDADWIEAIQAIKPKLTQEICLQLLGDFNWRTRLVGAYFAAIKNYRELTDIIGTQLLKSEVCCVGHIYALTLASFNDEDSIQYINRYLDYYLTKPTLYYDQQRLMEALLFLDATNGTHYFSRHLDNWKTFTEVRKHLEERNTPGIARLLETIQGPAASGQYLTSIQKHRTGEPVFPEYFEKQIPILRSLAQFRNG
jgi:hypothetical protein